MPEPLARERPRLRAFALYLPPAAAALAALDRRCCRWPLGDVETEAFRFCGAACARGQYCPAHARLAVRRRR